MKYAIYWTWNDNTEDTDNVYNAKDRYYAIKDMLNRNCFKSIYYCKIYKNGEYGKWIKVLQNKKLLMI